MDLLKISRRYIPEKFRFPLKKLISSFVPHSKKMEKEYWELKEFLYDAQWWDKGRINQWQFEKFSTILRFAYENISGYKTLYKEAGIKPEDIKVFDDIKWLPFTTKDLLRDNTNEFTIGNKSSRNLTYVTTGGSTGTPFGFYHTSKNRWMENAFMHVGWEWKGWKFGDLSAILRGNFKGSSKKIWSLDTYRNEINLSSYFLTDNTYPNYISVLQKYSPKYLQAYPSSVTLLADMILKNNDVGKIDFKSIFLGSENIYEWQKDKLHQAFPAADLFGWYGHSEQAILAPMCESSETYHIWPFYGFTEILNEKNENVQTGELGELVGTSFWSEGTPFIRYRTGDIAKKGHSFCESCKREFDQIIYIEGRKQDYIITCDGGYVTLTALIFSQHFKAFGSIKSMQLYQDTIGQLIVKIVPTNKFSLSESEELKAKMESSVGGRLNVMVMIVDDIPRTQLGKQKFLEQKLETNLKGL